MGLDEQTLDDSAMPLPLQRRLAASHSTRSVQAGIRNEIVALRQTNRTTVK